MINRAYKYRLYPNEIQAEFLNQNFGCARFLWNQYVSIFNSYSKMGPNLPITEMLFKKNPEYSWLNDVMSHTLQQVTRDFFGLMKKYSSDTRKTKIGRPQFKKKGVSKDSFRIPGTALAWKNFDGIANGFMKLPKMDSIKIVIDRPFTGNIRNITVSKNKAGQYFVSVLVKEEVKSFQRTKRTIGIDLGITDFAVLSDGTKIGNPKYLKESQLEVKKHQRHLSRKVKGSNRYNKQRLKLARAHNKVVNKRGWYQHNLSTWIVKEFDVICVENLNVKGMVKNHCLARAISDSAWSSFTTKLQYKAAWYGKTYHKIDRFYASSKTCSCCSNKVKQLPLDIRVWTCDNCGTELDRDVNAAINIHNKGLMNLYSLKSAELPDYRRGAEVRPSLEAIHPVMASAMKRLAFL